MLVHPPGIFQLVFSRLHHSSRQLIGSGMGICPTREELGMVNTVCTLLHIAVVRSFWVGLPLYLSASYLRTR